jgi:hypothetical protein
MGRIRLVIVGDIPPQCLPGGFEDPIRYGIETF